MKESGVRDVVVRRGSDGTRGVVALESRRRMSDVFVRPVDVIRPEVAVVVKVLGDGTLVVRL